MHIRISYSEHMRNLLIRTRSVLILIFMRGKIPISRAKTDPPEPYQNRPFDLGYTYIFRSGISMFRGFIIRGKILISDREQIRISHCCQIRILLGPDPHCLGCFNALTYRKQHTCVLFILSLFSHFCKRPMLL